MNNKKGFVMLASLMMLILLSILGLSMSKSFGLQEFVAGNQREKVRAFEAAQSALNYAEWWLNQGNGSAGSVCSTTAPFAASVCTNAFGSTTTTPPTAASSKPTYTQAITCGNATSYPWTTGVVFNDALGNNLTLGSSGVGTICVYPMFYIQYLGLSANNGYGMYQITSVGYGGNANAVAVLQSVFEFNAPAP